MNRSKQREKGGRTNGPNIREKGGRMNRPSIKVCRFCEDKALTIDYKDVRMLQRFVTERGKIIPRARVGYLRQAPAHPHPESQARPPDRAVALYNRQHELERKEVRSKRQEVLVTLSHETSATGLSQYSKRSGLRKGARDWWVGVWSSHFSRLSSYGFFWNCVSGRHWHFYSLHPFFFFLALFLCTPKKKGQKERRRSNAAGLLFRETRRWR